MRILTKQQRIAILLSLFVVTLVGATLVPSVPQNPEYHRFADMRSLCGIPNFGDVLSSAAFMVVGLLGLATLLGRRRRDIFAEGPDAAPYIVFFAAVTLIGIGSAYYHLMPDTPRLFWDRLPMTTAFMALFAAILADRVDRRTGNCWLLPLLILLGAASVIYWNWSESVGAGDLRFYVLVKFFPIITLPLILWLFPSGYYMPSAPLLIVFLTYGVAIVLDRSDLAVFNALGGAVSGHTFKHLVAAMAAYLVLHMVARTPRRMAV